MVCPGTHVTTSISKMGDTDRFLLECQRASFGTLYASMISDEDAALTNKRLMTRLTRCGQRGTSSATSQCGDFKAPVAIKKNPQAVYALGGSVSLLPRSLGLWSGGGVSGLGDAARPA